MVFIIPVNCGDITLYITINNAKNSIHKFMDRSNNRQILILPFAGSIPFKFLFRVFSKQNTKKKPNTLTHPHTHIDAHRDRVE